MTEAETIGIIAGQKRLKSYDAENLRNIYAVMIKYMGEKGDVRNFWPLPTDYDKGQTKYTAEYIEERNKNARELAQKLGIFKN